MGPVKALTRVVGGAGLLIICITCYSTRRDPEPSRYCAFCIDEAGKLSSLGSHARASNGQLLECAEDGWVLASIAACHEADGAVETNPPASSDAVDHE